MLTMCILDNFRSLYKKLSLIVFSMYYILSNLICLFGFCKNNLTIGNLLIMRYILLQLNVLLTMQIMSIMISILF